MGAIEIIVGVVAVMVLGGLAGGIIAGLKNRDISFWAGWGFVFPPAIIVVLLMPSHKGTRPRRPSLEEEDRALEDA